MTTITLHCMDPTNTNMKILHVPRNISICDLKYAYATLHTCVYPIESLYINGMDLTMETLDAYDVSNGAILTCKLHPTLSLVLNLRGGGGGGIGSACENASCSSDPCDTSPKNQIKPIEYFDKDKPLGRIKPIDYFDNPKPQTGKKKNLF